MSKNKHAAIEPNLGYYYQAFYGMIVLLKSNEESIISLETYDDIYLEEGQLPTLYQVKHKSKKIKQLNVKSDDLWKTLLIWSKVKDKINTKFILVTCDCVDESDSLNELRKENRDISKLKIQLLDEANRVISEREKYKRDVDSGLIEKQKLPPYENRISGCKALINLKLSELETLLKNTYILDSQFKIFDIEKEVGKLISVTVPKGIREKVVEKLIEWWSYRVIKSMMDNKLKDISKSELQIKISELICELREERFYINNFNIKPSILEAEEHEKESSNLLKQIELVRGGDVRKKKALINSWRSRRQRDEWIEDDFSNAYELNLYDESLIEAWDYKFELIKEEKLSEDEKIVRGLQLYDWSTNDAKNDIDVKYEKLKTGYIVHGTYQSLANELKLGWHCDFERILGGIRNGKH